MCEASLRIRLIAILEKLGLPTSWEADADAVWQAMSHDKKLSGNTITVVFAPKAGSFELRSMPIAGLKDTVYSFLRKKG